MNEAQVGQVIVDAWMIGGFLLFGIVLTIYIWTAYVKPPDVPRRPRIDERRAPRFHNKDRWTRNATR